MQAITFPAPSSSNPVDPRDIMRILGPEAFRLTPATLAVRMSKGKWVAAKHLQYLSAIIASELDKGNARIIISMPPRHGKSKLVSVRTPVWMYDRHPDRQIGITSYGADLAIEFSEEVRNIIMEDQDEEFGDHLLRVNLKTTKINNWTTTEGGRMYAVGVGGTLYGRGVHDLLVDDYYKNVEEAESKAYRDKVYEWFSVIAATRIEPGGSIVIIATRWNPDDLSGRLLAMPNSPWRELRIPGIAEENDPLGRLPGEALWPERYDVDALMGWKATMGSYFFEAIVQQKPRKSRSNLFEEHWIDVIEEEPQGSEWIKIRSWDLAGTEAGGDYTAGAKLCVNLNNAHVVIADMKRVQFSPGKVEELIKLTAELDSRETEISLEQEPGSSGKTVIEHYTKNVLKKYKTTAIRDTGSKFVRAQPFFAACERGQVSMVRGDWNAPFIDECSSFPEGDHDDQVDGVAQGYNKIFQTRKLAGTFGRTTKKNDAESARAATLQKLSLALQNSGSKLRAATLEEIVTLGMAGNSEDPKAELLQQLAANSVKKRMGAFSVTWGRRH